VTAPRLDVVIVSYRCPELLRACLESLGANPAAGGMRVVVVDNASGDATVEMVQSDFPWVELIANERNVGFAAASNQGATRGSADNLLFLNPDTRVTPGALDVACDAFEAHPGAGVVGVRLELPSGSLDHAAKRRFPTPLSALGHFTRIGRRQGARGALAAYRAPEVESGAVDAVNGAFMLVRRHAFDQVGGFDEGYWMYMEDLDLCYRLAQAGWTRWYEPTATVVHVKAGTSGPHRSLRLNWAFHFGMYRFYQRHYAPQRPWPLNLAVYVGIGVKLGASVIASAAARALAPLRGLRAAA